MANSVHCLQATLKSSTFIPFALMYGGNRRAWARSNSSRISHFFQRRYSSRLSHWEKAGSEAEKGAKSLLTEGLRDTLHGLGLAPAARRTPGAEVIGVSGHQDGAEVGKDLSGHRRWL